MKNTDIEKEENLNDEQKRKQLIPPVALDFYTIDQLASRFGCTVAHLRGEIRKGRLVGVQVGKPLIFSAANVQAFLKALESEKDGSQKKRETMLKKKK